MPQMAPMLWLILFFYFVLLFVIYIINFYFMVFPKPLVMGVSAKLNTSKFNWSW